MVVQTVERRLEVRMIVDAATEPFPNDWNGADTGVAASNCP
jgi:hypothetical protein